LLVTTRSWVRKLFARPARTARRAPARFRPRLEALEDRLAPATAITVLPGASGSGAQDSAFLANNGQLLFSAPDVGANTLSTGALAAVAPTNNIVVQATDHITFNDLGGTLSLQTAVGHSDTFSTDTAGGKAITFSNPSNTLAAGGGSIVLDAGTALTAANLNTGGGDVSLTAGSRGAGNLSAQGVLTAGSGNLTFTDNNGTISQSGTAAGQAISASASGNVTVDALRGTTVGLTSNSGSVTSAGSSNVQASSQLTVSAVTGITLNTLASALTASNSTSGNISITQGAAPAQTLTVSGTGVVNSAPGGAVTLDNLGSSITVGAGSAVQSSNGAVTLEATDLQLNGTVSSGTARTTLANSTAGRQIDVGTNTAGEIGLTQAELNNVTAGVLQIGSPTAAAITVSAPITPPPGWSTLALINNAAITEAAAGALGTGATPLPNLRVRSAGPVTLSSVNDVQNLSASVTGSGNPFSINNGTNTLTIPNAGVDGVLGVTTNNANITLEADNIRIFQVVTPGTGTAILEPFTQTLNITVGTASVSGSTFGITNGGLGWITSGITQVGVAADTGTITITNTINRTPTSTAPSRSQTLDLVTGNTTASAVTQTASLSVANLAVQSVGTVTLTNTSNAVNKLAAAVTGAGSDFTFTDSTGFDVGAVAGVVGITTHTGGGEIVTLTAGGSVTQDAGANITSDNLLLLGTGGYTLNNSGNDVDTLAANVTNAVSYTDADDLTVGTMTDPATALITSGVTTNGHDVNITASAVTSGTTLTVSNAIDTTSTANITLNADRMSLGASVNAHAGIVTLKPTTSGRAIDLGTNADTTHLGLLQTDLNNVTAAVVRVGDLGSGGSITVTAALTDATTGFNTLSLLTEIGASISQNAGATLTVTNLQAGGNTGVTLNQNNVVSTLAGAAASGAFSFVDSANLTVDSVDSGLGFGFGVGIITDGQAVSLTVNLANDSLTVNQHIDTTHNFGNPAPGGANINLSADNMALNNNSPASTINAGTGGILTLTPFSPSNTISVGGADALGTLGIDDNDLTNVSAKVVRIGSAAQAGAITVGGTINTHPGYNTLDLIAATGIGSGSITQTTGSIAVANLALQADAGIGSGGAIAVVSPSSTSPINVAFRNNLTGNVQIAETGGGGMTIAAVDQLDGTAGHTIGNFASGGTETLSATSPLSFAITDTGSGDITVTTTETATEGPPTNNHLPPPDDDLRVKSGATVESTGGNVTFTSGDSIIVESGATVKSDTGSVSLTAGSGDNDNDATMTLDGTVSSSGNLALVSPGDVVLGQISASEATGMLSVTSTGGSIRDDGNDSTFIEAHNINLTAAKAIGGDTQISRNDVLMQDATFKGAIDFDLGAGGTLTLSQTGAGGNIQLRNIDGTTNTSVLGGVAPVGTGNQLALIASGGGFANDPGNTAGDLVVDAALSVGAHNDNLLLASTNGNNVSVSHTVTNTGTGTVTLVVGGTAAGASGGALNVNAAVTAVGSVSLAAAGNAAGDGVFITANVTASGSGSSISVDANRDVNITGTNTKLSTTSATGGAITVTSAEGLPNFPTGGTGAVIMGSTTSIDTSANNSTITVDAGTTAGTGGDITVAVLNANTGAVNVKSFNGSIVDGNASANNVTGGAIGLGAGGAAGINLDVITSTPATAGVAATTTSGNITLRSTSQLQVNSISAGTTNDVSLTVNNANTAVSSITSLFPNDNVADVTGRTVTLTATGPTTGNTGQIGFFTTGPQFFEVAATTLNASTNNSRLWISAIGGTAIGSVSEGVGSTNTAFLRTFNGNLTSTHTGSTPDVIAGTVNLSLAPTGTSGSFGTSASPILIQAGTLSAKVAAGTGSINVTNVAAGGNLSVTGASTNNGPINLGVAGGNLTTTATTGTDISAPGNTVTLTVSGNVVSGTGAGVTDVGAASLAVTGTSTTSGVGTSASPLKTAVGTFAAGVGTGGVFVTNTGALLTLGTVGTLSGVTASGGNVSITTSNNLTVAQPVSTATSGPNAGAVTLTGGTAAGGTTNVNAAITGSTASVLGGTGADVITVNATGATPLSVNGMGGGDAISVTFGALNAAVNVNETGTGTNTLTVNGPAATDTYTVTAAQLTDNSATQQKVTYAGVQGLAVNGGNAGNNFNVQSTAAGTPVTVNTGNGSNGVQVGSANNSSGVVDNLAAALTVHAGSGLTGLVINDQGSTVNDIVTVDAAAVTLSKTVGAAPRTVTVNYSAVGNLELLVATGGGNDSALVRGTAANVLTFLSTGAGTDGVIVGSTSDSSGVLDNLLGPLSVDLGSGSNGLLVNDMGGTTTDGVVLTGTSVTVGKGSRQLHINYAATGGTLAVNIQTGSGNDVVNVQGTVANATTIIGTGAGNDTFGVAVTSSSGYALSGPGSLFLDGGIGSNELVVADLTGGGTRKPNPPTVPSGTLEVDYPVGLSSFISYANMETVT
jgi:hypothetical protein